MHLLIVFLCKVSTRTMASFSTQKTIAVVGSKNTGKSAYISRLVSGKFLDDYIPTEKIETSEFVYENTKFVISEYPNGQIPNNFNCYDGVIVFVDDYLEWENYFFPEEMPVAYVKSKLDVVSIKDRHQQSWEIAFKEKLLYNKKIFATNISSKGVWNNLYPFNFFLRAN